MSFKISAPHISLKEYSRHVCHQKAQKQPLSFVEKIFHYIACTFSRSYYQSYRHLKRMIFVQKEGLVKSASNQNPPLATVKTVAQQFFTALLQQQNCKERDYYDEAVQYAILSYLPPTDLIHLSRVNRGARHLTQGYDLLDKAFFQLKTGISLTITDSYQKAVDSYKELEPDLYQKTGVRYLPLIVALGGLSRLAALPQIQVKAKALCPPCFKCLPPLSHPVMRGIDPLKRPFIAFQFNAESQNAVGVLFQENASDPYSWKMSGITFLKGSHFHHFEKTNRERLQKLMSGQVIDL